MDSNAWQLAYNVSTQQAPEALNNHPVPPSEPTTRTHQPSNIARRNRTAFTPFQEAELKAEFAKCSSLYSCRRKEIADKLGLCERVVKVWFQNQRQKLKRERQQRSTAEIVVTVPNVASAASHAAANSIEPTSSSAAATGMKIPLIELKTAERVARVMPMDPVRFPGILAPTITVREQTPVNQQTQPDISQLKNEISEFLVVRETPLQQVDKPDHQLQPTANLHQPMDTTVEESVCQQDRTDEICPFIALQQELEAYNDQCMLEQQCQQQTTAAPRVHQPPQESDTMQETSQLDTSFNLDLDLEIEKFLTDPSVDEEKIDISEFLQYIDMVPEPEIDQGPEKNLAMAPPFDFESIFEF